MTKFVRYIILLVVCLFIFNLLSTPTNAQTATFSLTAPTGTLQRGQNVDFTISINTNGQTINSTSVGMTFDTQVLEFVSAAPGNTLTTVNAQKQDGGKIIFTGTNTNGFSGSGTFATVTFKIIATAPGSTELCVLFTPGETPTPNPTSSAPTTLPKTGSLNQVSQGVIVGFALILVLASGIVLHNKELTKPPHKTHTKTLH